MTLDLLELLVINALPITTIILLVRFALEPQLVLIMAVALL